MRGRKRPVNLREIMLDNILIITRGMVFGQTEAARIVGSLGRLLTLIEEGKIEVAKPSACQHGKWRCRADQVLTHCRSTRTGRRPANPKERLLEDILDATSRIIFGRDKSAKIVGGLGRLVELIAEGKIEASKPSASKSGKWRCRADQVFRHCRNMRTKPKQNQSQTIKQQQL